MAFNHAPRVSRAFNDISNALHVWRDNSTRFIVCQHDADAKVKKVHVHIGLWGADVQEEALKRQFNAKLPTKLSGNEDWKWKYKRFPKGIPSFEVDFVEPSNANEQQIFDYLKYLIKGDLNRVKAVKNISPELLKAAADAWVETVKSDKGPDVIIVEHKRVVSPPYQQLVIADAAADWHNYKAECIDNGVEPNKREVIKFVCDAMRKQSKGINPYLVKDLAFAILYDDLDYREIVLQKIISQTFL